LIYLDSSVALAQLFGEGRVPPRAFWAQRIASSRLLEFEVWNRVHSRGLGPTLDSAVRALCARVEFIEMLRPVLMRVLEPFPIQVRSVDAIHLSTLEFLRRQGEPMQLASYDHRMLEAARAMGIPIAPL
jgi:hypothetical protein